MPRVSLLYATLILPCFRYHTTLASLPLRRHIATADTTDKRYAFSELRRPTAATLLLRYYVATERDGRLTRYATTLLDAICRAIRHVMPFSLPPRVDIDNIRYYARSAA